MYPVGTKVVCTNSRDKERFGKLFTITSREFENEELIEELGESYKRWYYVGENGMWENHMRLATPLEEVLE